MIDPQVKARQLQVVQAGVQTGDYKCPGCGKRTRDKTGRCVACQRVGAGTERLHRLTTPQLRVLMAQVRAEIQRRIVEAQAALEGEP